MTDQPNFKTRLEAASLAFLDIVNELGDGRVQSIIRTEHEKAVRLARDFNENPPKEVTASTPVPVKA